MSHHPDEGADDNVACPVVTMGAMNEDKLLGAVLQGSQYLKDGLVDSSRLRALSPALASDLSIGYASFVCIKYFGLEPIEPVAVRQVKHQADLSTRNGKVRGSHAGDVSSIDWLTGSPRRSWISTASLSVYCFSGGMRNAKS